MRLHKGDREWSPLCTLPAALPLRGAGNENPVDWRSDGFACIHLYQRRRGSDSETILQTQPVDCVYTVLPACLVAIIGVNPLSRTEYWGAARYEYQRIRVKEHRRLIAMVTMSQSNR